MKENTAIPHIINDGGIPSEVEDLLRLQDAWFELNERERIEPEARRILAVWLGSKKRSDNLRDAYALGFLDGYELCEWMRQTKGTP